MIKYYVQTVSYINTEVEMTSATKVLEMLDREFYQLKIETKENIVTLRNQILKRANEIIYGRDSRVELIDGDEDFGWYEELNLQFSCTKEAKEVEFLKECEVLKQI